MGARRMEAWTGQRCDSPVLYVPVSHQARNPDVVAFMLVRPDDPGVHRDVVGDERIGDDALLETEVLVAVTSVDGRPARLELLAVATGVHQLDASGFNTRGAETPAAEVS